MRALDRFELRRNKNGTYNSMASLSILQKASHKLSRVRCLLSILYQSLLAMYADMDLKSALFHKKRLFNFGLFARCRTYCVVNNAKLYGAMIAISEWLYYIDVCQ